MSHDFIRVAVSVVAGSMSLIADAATAQVSSPDAASVDNFSRSRNISVQQRPRPDYDAPGVRAGGFLVYPRLELQAVLDDNIFATQVEQDDTIFRVRPEVAVQSNWSRHSLSAYVRASLNRYVDFDSENTDEYSLGGDGQIDVQRLTRIDYGASFTSAFEPRTAPDSPDNAVEPTALDTGQVYVAGSRSSGYFKLSGRADWRGLDYEDGRTGAGAIIEQDTRDREVISLSGRIDFAISPDTAFFFQATGNERTYDIASTAAVPNRDSSGTELLIGTSFELGALARGEISAGYIEQDFDEAAFADSEGYGARAQLEWFPSQLTTVTLYGSRTIEDSATPGVGGLLSSNLSVGIDHELLRNLILNGRVGWGRDEYEGIDREDTRITASLGGTYLINRNLGINLTASTLDSDSEGARRDIDFTVNKLAASLVVQF